MRTSSLQWLNRHFFHAVAMNQVVRLWTWSPIRIALKTLVVVIIMVLVGIFEEFIVNMSYGTNTRSKIMSRNQELKKRIETLRSHKISENLDTTTKNAKKASNLLNSTTQRPFTAKIQWTPRAEVFQPDPWVCPFEYPRTEKNLSKIIPKYNLRRDKFLLNLSPYGPNNQFRGFRDSVILAYYLRVLV